MKKFKAIILAAGKGSRLLPLTKNKPKCLVKVKGKSILDRQISLLEQMGASQIIVVTGYRHQKINNNNIINIINKDYNTSNMVYSLMLAKKYLTGNVIVSYGDIVYKPKVLMDLINQKSDIVITSDLNWNEYWSQRFKNPLDDIESFIKGDNKLVKSLGQKPSSLKKIQGQFIGLIKFSDFGCREFISAYFECKNSNDCKLNAWGSNRKLKLSYMTDILNFLANQNKLYFNETKRGWVEIDNLKDLQIANNTSWI